MGRKQFLYVYGRINYRDANGRDYFTAFGLVYHLPVAGDPRGKGWMQDGPEAYNDFA